MLKKRQNNPEYRTPAFSWDVHLQVVEVGNWTLSKRKVVRRSASIIRIQFAFIAPEIHMEGKVS